jgi:acetylglutamate kinase
LAVPRPRSRIAAAPHRRYDSRAFAARSPMTTDPQASASEQARLLSAALPYMQRYENKTVVVKYGGHAMGNAELGRAFARDIALLKQSGVNPIVVHGGGPQIGAMLDRMGIESRFEGGLRVTDQKTVEIVEMVLAGSINKEIVALINAEGEWAIGLCGKDGNMVFAEKAQKTVRDPDSNIERVLDLGFVGEPAEVDRTLLDLLARSEMIPVLAPVAPGRDGHTYNINADTFAGAIAGAVQAKRLLFLTDVPGVLDRDKKLIDQLTVAEARALIADGTISGGMIPKVETCIYAIERGVEGVVILNGKTAHSVLLELFTEHGAGTLIVP